MSEWIDVKFKDYVFFQEGPGLMSYLFREEGFPFMNIRCIENGKIIRENCQYIPIEIACGQYKHFQLDENDLIVSTSGTLGKKAFVRKEDLPLLLNTSIIRFRPKEETSINRKFLNYILEDYTFLYDLKKQSTGSAQVNVGPSHLEKIWIRIPNDIVEQTRIAEILSTADEAIAHTEALITKYQRIKTGLMQDLLTKGIDENGNIRSKATHKFVVKNGIEVPEEWEVETLGGLKPYITSGSRNWAEYYSIEGSAFIRIGNLTREHINLRLDDVQRVNVKNSSEGKRTKLVKDDIIISITADLGIIGVIPEEFEEAYINQHIALVRFYDENINPRFIGLFLASYSGVQQFDLLNDSGAKAGLSLRTIQNLKVLLPDYSEQCLIVSKIDSIDNHIQNEKLNLKKLQSLKTGLMQDLLSGKVRVNMDNKN